MSRQVTQAEHYRFHKLRERPRSFQEACELLERAMADARVCVEAHNAAGWRDIASAPKTGLDLKAISILCWCPDHMAPDGGDQFVLWWEPLMNKKKGLWFDGEVERHPTHWMLLPAPPVSP